MTEEIAVVGGPIESLDGNRVIHETIPHGNTIQPDHPSIHPSINGWTDGS